MLTSQVQQFLRRTVKLKVAFQLARRRVGGEWDQKRRGWGLAGASPNVSKLLPGLPSKTNAQIWGTVLTYVRCWKATAVNLS